MTDITNAHLFPFSYEEFNNQRKKKGYALRELQAWPFESKPNGPPYWINRTFGGAKPRSVWWDEFKLLELTNGELTDIVMVRFSPHDADHCMVFSALGATAALYKELPLRPFYQDLPGA